MYIIGIDGGGTSTRGVIAKKTGELLFTAKDTTTNYHQHGELETGKTLDRLINALTESQGIKRDNVSAICMGMSGVDRADDLEVFQRICKSLGIDNRTYVVNDAVIGLVGGALDSEGIMVISGTGSVCWGRKNDGTIGRVGGWGYLLADTGSGYRIACEGVRAIMKSFDGLEPPTIIKDKILGKLGFDKETKLVGWSMREGTVKSVVAALAVDVFQAYIEGDKTAERILKNEAYQFGVEINCLWKKLTLPDNCTIVLGGGVFDKNPDYYDMVESAVKRNLSNSNVIHPQAPAEVGAVIYAITEALSIPIMDDLKETVIKTL